MCDMYVGLKRKYINKRLWHELRARYFAWYIFAFSHIMGRAAPDPRLELSLIAGLPILGHSVAPLFCIVHIVLTNLPDLFIGFIRPDQPHTN